MAEGHGLRRDHDLVLPNSAVFVTDPPGIVPKRIERANPDAIANRWVNFILSLDGAKGGE